MTRPFTGRHIAAILVAFFAVIIVVNLTMARLATSTFGGVVVDNSYVASQHFNRWLDEADRAKAMGWAATVSRLADGRVQVDLAGPGAAAARLGATARNPLGRMADQDLAFAPLGKGRFVSSEPLPAGRWTLRLQAEAGGQAWRAEQELF